MSRLFFHAFRDFVAIRFVILFICFSLISCFTHALQVVPGSNCTAACTEHFRRTNTTSSDITCYDEDYNTTAVGKAFRDCVTCEFDSSTFDQQTNQTDLGWALCTYGFGVYKTIEIVAERPGSRQSQIRCLLVHVRLSSIPISRGLYTMQPNMRQHSYSPSDQSIDT